MVASRRPSPRRRIRRILRGALAQISLVLVAAVATGAQEPLERTFRALTLENGLEVFLVHDPAADRSGAALSVQVGALQDGEVEGLAHFLEHMLFLGTARYPDPGAYKDFLAAHDGRANAYTKFDQTNYHFEVKQEAFAEALDLFSRFFIDPLLTDALSEREIHAVDSEHAKNLQDDFRRARQVYRSLLNPAHPASRFTTGNQRTLAGVKNERLRAFYREHYSANLMHLALVSRHPLDELEHWAREKFSPVENRGYAVPTVAAPLFGDGIAGRRVEVRSLTEYRQLWLRFELPPEVFDFAGKPARLVSSILGHEGTESLLERLRQEELATALSTSSERIGAQGTFDVTVTLTRAGLVAVDTVLERVFGMVNLLRRLPRIPEYLVGEAQAMGELRLRYPTPASAFDEAEWLAALMIELPHEDLLENCHRIRHYDAGLTRAVLDALTPERAAVLVIAEDREGDRIEEHYGVRHGVQPLAPELVERLRRAEPVGAMGLPAANTFLPSDFTLVEPTTATAPARCAMDFGEVWLRHDVRFRQPRAALRLRVGNDENRASAREFALGLLFARAANGAINPHRYPMKQAGMELTFSSEREGLVLDAQGFSHKLPDLVGFAAPYLREVRVNERQFAVVRDEQLRLLKNKARQPPHQTAMDVFRETFREVHFTDDQLLEAVAVVTRADLVDYAERARREIWLEGFAYGNLTAAQVQGMAGAVFQALAPARALEPGERFQRRVLRLSPGTSVSVRRKVESNDGVTLLLYQNEPFTTESRAAFHVLRQVVPNRFFQDLRTRQQTGYVVHAGGWDIEGIPHFYFLAQSGVAETAELRGRFEAFVRHLAPDLAQLPPAEFESSRQAARSELLARRKDLREELAWNFDVAFDRHADFGCLEREARALAALTRERWLEWTERFFAEEKARRVSIELLGGAERHAFPEKSVPAVREAGGGFWQRPPPEKE